MNFEPTARELKFFEGLDPAKSVVPRIRMGDISAARRRRLDDSDFALPGRRYPIDTLKRARHALARIAQFGTADEIRKVRRAVHRRWPEIDMPEYAED